MVVMLGFNLFVFASLRDRNYLLLSLLIAIFGFNDAFREGMAQQYLWPAWPNLYGIEITATLTYSIIILFGVSFLQTNIRTPRLHKVIMATLAGFLLTFFYYLLLREGVKFYEALALFTSILGLSIGYVIWRQGYRPARYYLLAWLLFLGVTLFYNLANATLLSGIPFGQQILRITTVLVALLLSLALADRINLLKAETAKANKALTDEIQERKVAQQALGESEKNTARW